MRDHLGQTFSAQEVAACFADTHILPKIVLLVGIPASGKSTLAAALQARGFYCLSRDRIRAELTGDETDHDHEYEVTRRFNARLHSLLRTKRCIVVDTTNVCSDHRWAVLRPAGRHGYNGRYLIHLDLPLRTCLKRNLLRERNVPPEVLINMHRRLHHGDDYPGPGEGQLLKLRPTAPGHYRIQSVRF